MMRKSEEQVCIWPLIKGTDGTNIYVSRYNYLLLHNKLPHTEQPNKTLIYQLTHLQVRSMAHHGCIFCSGSQKLNIKMSDKPNSHLETLGGEIYFQVHFSSLQKSVPCNCRIVVIYLFLLAVSQVVFSLQRLPAFFTMRLMHFQASTLTLSHASNL